MLINELVNKTGLTKKAIEYYTEKGFVKPQILKNSYREYSESDLKILLKVKVLRTLDLSIKEIKEILIQDNKNEFKKIVELKTVSMEISREKLRLLNLLNEGIPYHEILPEVNLLEQKQSIEERLISLFPNFIGKYLRYNFGSFLKEPIQSKEQEEAYLKIIKFLDNVPNFEISEELENFLEENTKYITNETLLEMIDEKNNITDIDEFLTENDEKIKAYLKYKETEEYKNSNAHKIKEAFYEFMSTSGFHDIFIKNLRILSNSYDEYYINLLKSNEEFLKKYPQLKNKKN